jgi:hypothetical protein
MAMKYQKGTVYLRGERVKMWYGKYLIYGKDKDGKEARRHRNVAVCPRANTPKWKAEQLLREMILKECGVLSQDPALPTDSSVTFRWFVKERYIPMRQGKWSPAYRKTNIYQLEHYLVSKFGDLPLRKLDSFQIQIWLNDIAEKQYSESVVRSCFSNMRAITRMAKKQKYITDNPGEDVTMPQAKMVQRPVMIRGQILSLIGALRTFTIFACFALASSVVRARVRRSGCSGSPGPANLSCLTELHTKAGSTTGGSRRG